MESCQYEELNVQVSGGEVPERTQFFRQLLVSSSIWILYFTMGLCNGAPTVIIPQLRREANSTAAVSDEMASWMSSIHNFAAIPWIFVLPIFTDRRGRKLPFIFISFCSLCSFFVFYFGSSVIHILISEIMQGIIPAGLITISIVIITEYSSPRYRGMFLTLKSASFTWGIWCSNAIGTFFHWKKIAILGIFTSFYCITTSLFWTESPLWLASKGHYEKCAESHRWLKGTGVDSEKELKVLLDSQKSYINGTKMIASNNRLKNIVFSKDFCKPVSLCFVILSLYCFSGKFVCTIYAVDIIKKITGEESKAYTGMLILDGVTVLGMYVGCALSKIIKRRTLLLSGSSVGILFLFLMSLYFYLIKLDVIIENNFVSICSLSVFSVAISSGPLLMSTSIFGEIVPLRFRSFSLFVIGLYNVILVATLLKVAPLLFKNLEVYGAFLFYGVTSTICTLLLYKYLPETKDKTLQEIEDSMLQRKTEKEKQLVLLKQSESVNGVLQKKFLN